MAKDDRASSSIVQSPSSSSSPAAPHPLGYDDLPPGSDIRREYKRHGDGDDCEVRIVVPAGEPPPAATRAALHESFASGARASWALLLLSFLLFSMAVRNNRIGGVSLAWAWAFFAVFCGALVLLIGWVRYGALVEAIRMGREQMTVLAATPTRLLIETDGPFETAGHDLLRDRVASIAVRRRGLLRDNRNRPRRVPHLALTLSDGRTLGLLPGRDARELEWVRAAISDTMRLRR